MIRSLVARPIPPNTKISDESPALIEGTSVLVGNKYHASRVPLLVKLGVTHVLNCASGGISSLPMDEILSNNIHYKFTNVRQDDHAYPILFDPKSGEASKHLQTAKAVYADVVKAKGRVLFFCVAGQNRSPTLAVAVCMLFGHSLDEMLKSLSKSRPFVLENKGEFGIFFGGREQLLSIAMSKRLYLTGLFFCCLRLSSYSRKIAILNRTRLPATTR
jgi:hypothetical protein